MIIAKNLNVTEPEAYVLYCYIDTLIAKTLLRSSEGGDGHILALSNLAITGVKKEVNEIMAYDLPRVLYAQLMSTNVPAGKCADRIKRYLPSLNETSESAMKICTTSALDFESAQSYYTWVKFYTD